jgi:Na+-translocating ferredoxin:NAD+ oxidoreductase RnfD subunit
MPIRAQIRKAYALILSRLFATVTRGANMQGTLASVRKAWASFTADARHVQIAALSTLVLLSNTWSDFGAGPLGFIGAVCGALTAQAIGSRLTGAPFEVRSALITSLGITVFLRAANPLFWFAAGLAGVGLKFLVRYKGKHIFNPGNIGAASMVLVGAGATWISPGQWGQVTWIVAVMLAFGALVLSCARRLDIAIAFLGSYATLLFARAFYMGDPLSIPLHQLQNGSLIVVTCFMITDPRATPDARTGRILFAILVAGLAHYLQFHAQMRPGLLFALAAVSPLTILFDKIFPARRFTWAAPSVGDTVHANQSNPGRGSVGRAGAGAHAG